MTNTDKTLSDALHSALSMCQSINTGFSRKVERDGCVLYLQAKEWCEWVQDDVAPKLRAALDAIAAQAQAEPTPDWRELCRRLYVELCHCDQQMTGTSNDEGEPVWETGKSVSDVLKDAATALDAPQPPEGFPQGKPGCVLIDKTNEVTP